MSYEGENKNEGDEVIGRIPDPNGPPEPVTKRGSSLPLLFTIVGLGVLGAAVLAPGPCHTQGAPRSTRLEWDQRREQIEQALREQERADREPAALGQESPGPGGAAGVRDDRS